MSDNTASEPMPSVPDRALTCIHAYGDARADDDGTSAVRLMEAIAELRRWGAALAASTPKGEPAALPPSPAPEPVPLNPHIIYDAISHNGQRRTSFENVQDVLAAIATRPDLLRAAAPQPVLSGEPEGIEQAARWVQKRLDDFVSAHGHADLGTGAVEFGTGPRAEAKQEYVGELMEIVEGIRALKGAGSAPEAAPGRDAAGWQPIETAPPDVDLLLTWWSTWTGDWKTEVNVARRSNTCHPMSKASNASAHGQATHWMPLPPTPVENIGAHREPARPNEHSKAAIEVPQASQVSQPEVQEPAGRQDLAKKVRQAIDSIMDFRHTREGMVRGGRYVNKDDVVQAVLDRLTAPQAAAPAPDVRAALPPGWVAAPLEPTHDMLSAMAECDGWMPGDRDRPGLARWEDYWRKAIAALPESPAPAVQAEPAAFAWNDIAVGPTGRIERRVAFERPCHIRRKDLTLLYEHPAPARADVAVEAYALAAASAPADMSAVTEDRKATLTAEWAIRDNPGAALHIIRRLQCALDAARAAQAQPIAVPADWFETQKAEALFGSGYAGQGSTVRDVFCAGFDAGVGAALPVVPADPADEIKRLKAALWLAVAAMRAPIDGWKGEAERKALDAANELLAAGQPVQQGGGNG